MAATLGTLGLPGVTLFELRVGCLRLGLGALGGRELVLGGRQALAERCTTATPTTATAKPASSMTGSRSPKSR